MDSILELSVFNTMLNRYGLIAGTLTDVPMLLKQLEDRYVLWDDALNLKRDCEIYLLQNLLKKSETMITDANIPKINAYKTWRITEARNGFTNLRLAVAPRLIDGPYLSKILLNAQKIVRKYMGKCPSLDELVAKSDWPTGATAEKKRQAPIDMGLQNVVQIHEGADVMARQYLVGFDGEHNDANTMMYCNHSRMDSVKKTYKTDRVIEKGLAVMVSLQKGAGRVLRSRLTKHGICLNTQADLNRELCRLSLENRTCTIDLKEASDSITIQLVNLLVDEQWFDLLNILRNSHTIDLTGVSVKLEKFSANGNGFTFELETIIFRALTEATCEFCDFNYPRELIATFGDDIICPVNAARLLMRVLAFCGFIVNKDKSFVDGNFYESCGHHYAFNCLVTPVYFKKPIISLQEYIVAFNKLYKWSVRTGNFAFTRKALLLIKNEAIAKFRLGPRTIKVRGKKCVWDNTPLQPVDMKGDFGFISESPGVYTLQQGFIVLNSAICKRDVILPVSREWFYYCNRLRGGESFYSEVFREDPDPCLGRNDPSCTETSLKRNYKVYESNRSCINPCLWIPTYDVRPEHSYSSWLPKPIERQRKITSKVLKDLLAN